MEAMTIVTIAALMQFMYFSIEVGKMRQKHGVKAPAMSGDGEYERANRVHQNTMEQLVVLLPAMWICGQYFNPQWAAGLGVVFIIARFMYRSVYMKDPSNRTLSFTIGFLATAALMLGSVVGAVRELI